MTPSSEAPAGYRLPVLFTGSGSEYFRLWIVNLLLMLVTLGLYYPWAKQRRLRYFYGNTLVGGHALDFHGNPWAMLHGLLLVGALLLAYSLAGRVSPLAGGIALLIVAAVWPALMRSSLQFRLANTSWRGLRFRFDGGLGAAYAVFWPLALPLAVILFRGVMGPQVDPASPYDEETPERAAVGAQVMLILGSMFASVLMLPLLIYQLTRYRHDHFALSSWRTRLRARPGAFYALAAQTSGVTVLAMIAATAIALALAVGISLATGSVPAAAVGSSYDAGGPLRSVLSVLWLVSFYAVIFVVVTPYTQARLQNLAWGRTRGDELAFHSSLRVVPLMLLTLKNLALCLLTLGLYWPFARVALARLRLEAVSVYSRTRVDELVAGAAARRPDAAGDAAGDLLGVDIGL